VSGASLATTVTVVGCGDAFGSGGRFNTCFLVDTPGLRFAIDFGATSLVALAKLGIDHNSIDAIVLTHFHGDHCGGVPFLLLDAMLAAKRQRPLAIIGPRETRARITAVAEALLPGMPGMIPKFELTYLDFGLLQPVALGGTLGALTITGYPAAHTDATSPACVRVAVGDKVIAYTGDSAWTEHMPALAQDADLFICESYHYAKPVRFHLNYPEIQQHRAELRPKRILLTHFSREMLLHTANVAEECAHDGMVIAI
jgi:ribonuclease BN (tRNA processing enzyme)